MAVVLAAPAPARLQKRSFRVDRVPNPNFKDRSPGAGTRALVKAYRKFSIPLPPGVADALDVAQSAAAAATVVEAVPNQDEAGLSKADADEPDEASAASTSGLSGATNDTGTVTATPEKYDVEYLCPVSIGGQTMIMDFDSGSSDFWVFSTQTPASDQTGHGVFDPTKSATFKPIEGATFDIAYGDGSGAAGSVGTDIVDIGGAIVSEQAVELATYVSGSFVTDLQSDGLVGLAFSKLNTVRPTRQLTFFDNAVASLPIPVFTADLRKSAAGSYEFGHIDSSKFTGPLSWVPVNTTNGFWQFSSQKFAVGNGSTLDVAGGQAMADTGTTLILADPAVVNAYYSQVQGAANNDIAGGVVFPCNAQLPDLQLDVGGAYMATVRGDDLNFSPVDTTGIGQPPGLPLTV